MATDKFDMLNDSVKELKDKLENVDQTLQSIDRTLVRNTESLEYHVKRTNLLEQQVTDLKEELDPIATHVDRVNFLVKLIGALGGSVAVIYYGLQIIEKLSS